MNLDLMLFHPISSLRNKLLNQMDEYILLKQKVVVKTELN